MVDVRAGGGGYNQLSENWFHGFGALDVRMGLCTDPYVVEVRGGDRTGLLRTGFMMGVDKDINREGRHEWELGIWSALILGIPTE